MLTRNRILGMTLAAGLVALPILSFGVDQESAADPDRWTLLGALRESLGELSGVAHASVRHDGTADGAISLASATPIPVPAR